MSYTDLTSSFAYKDLLSWSKMDQLAANDAYDVLRSGTKTVFYQSSLPAGWTKQTGFNDSALRVVSGSSGGTLTAGTQGLSATVGLAHTHTSGTLHNHGGYDHQHKLDYTLIGVSGATGGNTVFVSGSNIKAQTSTSIGSTNPTYAYNMTDTSGSSAAPASVSVGTTSSSLSDVAFAYCDVIIASKDA